MCSEGEIEAVRAMVRAAIAGGQAAEIPPGVSPAAWAQAQARVRLAMEAAGLLPGQPLQR
jgi:hypothetical protein